MKKEIEKEEELKKEVKFIPGLNNEVSIVDTLWQYEMKYQRDFLFKVLNYIWCRLEYSEANKKLMYDACAQAIAQMEVPEAVKE